MSAPVPDFNPSSAAPAVRLAVDCMGGDSGPSVTLPACRAFLAAHPQAELILVGRPEALAKAKGWPRCTIVPAAEVVDMTDSIEVALRRKSTRRSTPTGICAPGPGPTTSARGRRRDT